LAKASSAVSALLRGCRARQPPEVITGTLAYMAPEQTGRMNRSIDNHSDSRWLRPLAWWLIWVAAGGELFALTHRFLASSIGIALLFLWSVALFYYPATASDISLETPVTPSRSAPPLAAATPCSPQRHY
jgi:hypothetical protein